MNIYDYVDNYGIYTFDEKPITLVDKVIFSFLSYVNFQGIVKYNKITIKGYSNYSSTGTLSMGSSSSKKSIPSSTDLSISSYCTKYSQLNIRNGEFKHEIDISTWKDTGYFLMLGYTYNSTFIITDLCFS